MSRRFCEIWEFDTMDFYETLHALAKEWNAYPRSRNNGETWGTPWQPTSLEAFQESKTPPYEKRVGWGTPFLLTSKKLSSFARPDSPFDARRLLKAGLASAAVPR